MKTTPKMLPYLARSAGITDLRAEELWWEASHYARNATSEFETPKYWKVAYERLVNLVQAEAMVKNPPEAAPWMTLQTNLGTGLLAATDLFAQVSANVRRWFTRTPNASCNGRP
jgi:hypothetical protein